MLETWEFALIVQSLGVHTIRITMENASALAQVKMKYNIKRRMEFYMESAHSLPKLAYKTSEVAHMLSVTPRTVSKLVSLGKLRSVSSLRTYIIPAKELERFLKEGTSDVVPQKRKRVKSVKT